MWLGCESRAMTEIKIQADGWEAAIRRAIEAKTNVNERVKTRVRSNAFKAERGIKRLMPVDTGRARASWGHWDGALVKPNPEANPADAVWREENNGWTIVEGTTVHYVADLNAGSSRQAPAGFIDAVAYKVNTEMAEEIAQDLRQLL